MSSEPKIKRSKLSGKASGSSSERSDDEQVVKESKIDVLDKGETSSSVQQSEDVDVAKNQFVGIFDFNNEETRIPLDASNNLTLANFERIFPGGVGLRYKSNSDPFYTAIDFNDVDKYFVCPLGGWNGKHIHVIYKENKAPSPYSFVQRSLPKANQVDKYSFFIFNQKRQKTLATKISAFYFATYQHLDHSHYKVEDEVDVYSLVDDDLTYETVVKFVSKNNDFILLRTDNVGKEPPISNYIHSDDHVMICGFGSSYGKEGLTHDIGCINSPRMAEFNGKDGKCGPFLLCTFESKPGDSGGSVWDCDGLVGLNVGRTSFSSEYFENDLRKSINNAALFNAKAFVVPIEELLKAKNSIDPPCDDYHPLTAEIGGEILTQ